MAKKLFGGDLSYLHLHLATTVEALDALVDLNLVPDAARGAFGLPVPRQVEDFRLWLGSELASQLAGNPPQPCGLPD